MAAIVKGKVFNPAMEINYSEGSVVSQEILRNNTATITLFAFAQGQGLSEHTAPFDAIVNILDGEAEIFIAGVVHYLQKGDMLILPANIPHALHAQQAFKMLLTMIREKKSFSQMANTTAASECRCG